VSTIHLRKESLEEFVARAPIAVALFDQELHYLAASRRWLAAHGLDGADVVGRALHELSPELPAAWDDAHRHGLAGASVEGVEGRLAPPNGKVVWMRLAVQPWHVGDAVAGILVFAEDINARKEAERISSECRARTLAILDTTPDAIVTFDRRGTIESVSAGAEIVFGCRAGDLVGHDVRELLPSPSRDHVERFIDHCVRGDDARLVGVGIETEARRHDGSVFPAVLALAEIDHLELFTANIRDVSKRKAAEQANAFKSRFLAAASHDLRQPLQSLGLYLSVLARQLHDPAQREICDKMRQSRDAVADILEALLDISKLESGAVTPRRSTFPLHTVLSRIVADTQPQAEQKGLQLRCFVTPDCRVHSDPALLERVIENLVGNAIRYTERGGVSISCKRDGAVIRIAIEDSGIGIPPEALERIFDEYYRVGDQSRGRGQGLGLGLSIVKHIAQLLDHPIEVRSRPGEGSTFTVTVPVGEEAVAAVSAQRGHAVASAKSGRPVVLLIDDEPAIVDATTLLLEAAGLTVHAASDGQTARTVLAGGVRPDMVVCDYRLPGANGIEVIRQLRAQAATVVPAILLTGDTSGHEIARAEVPSCLVLHKPVDADRLIGAIEQSLRPS
jgi:PAS domain S-box-containing protein